MLVQPLGENAIKHGVEPLTEGAAVHVSAQREPLGSGGECVVLRVADDGAGFRAAVGAGTTLAGAAASMASSASTAAGASGVDPIGSRGPHEGDGVGLTNIRERLRVLYGDAARLTLTEGVPRGVVATLRLPVGAPGSPTA
jgi:sensor histidine kinase YesM